VAFELDGLAGDFGIGVKAALPEIVIEDTDGLEVRRLILVGKKSAPDGGVNAES
jgi:hypothetical protein